jgi:hypothetical protein
MDAQTLIKLLTDHDNSRARSQQTAIGVSSLGGCRRQVWHKSQGHQGTNPTSKLAAILGTAIHTHIETVLPKDDGALIEHRVEVEGYPPATIDYFKDGEVVDWKTIKMSGRDYFVTKQKRWQVQTYGFLLAQTGVDVHTVTLVGIPRDGTEADIIVHSEPYDPTVALEAFAWLKQIEDATEAPAPEREPVSFCQKYCEFYGSLCNGIGKDTSGEPIVDETITTAAKRYTEIFVEEKTLTAEKDATKAALEGVAGITIDGIKIGWSSIAGRSTPDQDAIKAALGDIPMKQGAPSMRLTVK